MDATANSALEEIGKAAEALKRIRPLYGHAIDYYEQLLMVQARVTEDLHMFPMHIPRCRLKMKVKRCVPLVSPSDFPFDERAARILLEKIGDLIVTAGLNSPAINQKFKALINDGFELTSFLRCFLDREENKLNHMASSIGLDKEFLSHVAHQSLMPSIQSFAKSASSCLPPNYHWNKGLCPVCGEPPAISTIDGRGKRSLHCSFCRHQWHINRGFCPFCGNHEPRTLFYFYSEEEAEYRVDLCEKCKTYVKCVDTRNTHRWVYPPIEQVAMAHLDIAAQEEGFVPAAVSIPSTDGSSE
jgi:FdhE protein